MNFQNNVIITGIIFLGVLYALSLSPIFADTTPVGGMSGESFLSFKSISNTWINNIINEPISAGIAATVIFGMLLFTRAPIAIVYGMVMTIIVALIENILSYAGIPSEFITVITVVLWIVYLFAIIQYFSRTRSEEL